ncbi:MAG: MEKHLA domain-containing protein [Methyloceanibacter sp.]
MPTTGASMTKDGVMILASDPDFFDLLVSSYRRTVGSEPAFLEHGQHHSAKWLYQTASHPVLAHNTDPDPRFIYANKAAQAAFEYDWEEITELPSRLSAEPVDLEDRQRLLDAVARRGFATGYSGLRIAKSGRRFWIEDGIVWQLINRDGAVRGQAATFARWRDA